MNAITARGQFMGDFEKRVANTATRSRPIGPECTMEAVRKALEVANDMPVVEDAYRINGRSVIDETPVRDSRDPDLPLIDEAYQVTAPGKAWFILSIGATAPSPERVRRFIARKGFVTYWPRRVDLRSRGRGSRRKKIAVVSSLFSRYVLVHMPAKGTVRVDEHTGKQWVGQPYHAHFGAVTVHEGRFHGVGDWLASALGPVPVADVLVERLVARERDGEFDQTVRKGRRRGARFPDWCFVGGFIEVADGPFAGHRGLVEETDEVKERLKAAVEIFGRATLIDLELAQVRALC